MWKDSYLKNGASDFDREHGVYRVLEFIKFMDLREKEFINTFRFEGDEEFTRAKQRVFLKHLFKYGYAGILSTVKLLNDNAFEDIKDIVDVDKIIVDKAGNKIPLIIAPYKYDENERILKGTGTTSGYHNSGTRKTYETDITNTAYALFDNNHKSGYLWWLIPAYNAAMASTVLKKRLSLVDGKLVKNTVNNSADNQKFAGIYDVDLSFLDLSPSQISMTGSKSEEINVMSMLDQKLKKLDLSNGETVGDLMQFVQDHEQMVLTSHGVRTNINDGKKERSITADFESMETHWRRLENELKDQFEMFTEEYKQIFGKEIKVISIIDEILEDMREQDKEDEKKKDKGANNDKNNSN